jgi:hypothetical protein
MGLDLYGGPGFRTTGHDFATFRLTALTKHMTNDSLVSSDRSVCSGKSSWVINSIGPVEAISGPRTLAGTDMNIRTDNVNMYKDPIGERG